MAHTNQKLWITLTAALTVVVLVIVYPILSAKFGTATAILLCGLLVLGMALYYMRGASLFRSKK